MYKSWNVRKPDIALQKKLASELNIPPLIAQLFINRGITAPCEAERFLSCRLSDLNNPFLLEGMGKAAARIKKAIDLKENIVIWGDYDVDGLTAVALLKTTLVELGGCVRHYIPHRIEEGYGLNLEGAERIYKERNSLVITVDCGIGSFKEVEFLNSAGIDTIITDHHHPLGKKIPPALCVINPLQDGCGYPFKYLAGVGLAFKLSQAVTGQNLFEYLDLVALGTISDIAPMLDENRILVKHGLNQLSKTKKTGLIKLLEKVGLEDKEITTMHAGFLLGPRLNATGRIGSAENSLKLLLTASQQEAEQLASQLNEDNRRRQQLEAKILCEALAKIEREINFKEHRVIVLCQDDWHPGVMGIVASRVVERFYRPAILLSLTDEGIIKGSGRSIENFHLFDALARCKEFLEGFGGHSKACGLSLRREFIDNFKDAINSFALNCISPDIFMPKLNIDAEIPLSLLDEKMVEFIQMLSPFGEKNPKPIFGTRAVCVKAPPTVVGRNTLKMWLSDGDVTYEAVGFNMADKNKTDGISELVDVVYTAAMNDWQGQKAVELHLKDLRDCDIAVKQPL